MNIGAFIDGNMVFVQTTFTTLLLALSIQVPLRLGVFSFAGVGFYGLGAYTAGALVVHRGWGTFEALGAAVVLCMAVGLILALALRRLGGLYLGMATIAFDLIVATVAVNGGSLTGGSQGLIGALSEPELTLGPIIAISLVAVAAIAYTETGPLRRKIEAVREDPELATSLGLKVSRYRGASFVASGALGGCAGAITLLLRTTIAPENVSFHLIVLSLTVIVVGGLRSWIGVAIGTIVFTWLPHFLSVFSDWSTVIYGVLVVLVAIFVPQGILGLVVNARRRVTRRSRPAETIDGPGNPVLERTS